MDRKTVSIHEVRIFQSLKSKSTWLTSEEVSEQAKVAPRTARMHLLRFSKAGLCERAEVFPGFRYKLASDARKRSPELFGRLVEASEQFKERR